MHNDDRYENKMYCSLQGFILKVDQAEQITMKNVFGKRKLQEKIGNQT